MTMHWSVAQIFSKRIHLIRDEIEKGDRGVLIPTFGRRRYVDGKENSKTCPLFPGYVFFQSTKEWGDISKIEGVIRVLGNGQRLRDMEAYRLAVDDAMHAHADLQGAPLEKVSSEPQRKYRRPRRSKRIERKAARSTAWRAA